MRTLTEIISILSKSGYVIADVTENTLQNFKFLPLGYNFLNKVRSEWTENRTTINTYTLPTHLETQHNSNDDMLTFLKSNQFKENFLYVKNNFQKEVPLAIKDELHVENVSFQNHENIVAHILQGKLLGCTYFLNENNALEYFYKIQRERKIWWMKFSSHPGRYYLSDLKSDKVENYKTQSVKIKSKFNFGDLEVENIQLIPLKALNLENQNEFILKDVKVNKKLIPSVIRTEFLLEVATLGLLLDSVEDTKNEKIHIHRKIAPYQCSLFCLSKDDHVLLELQDLATHLTNVMRRVGISVLNLQKCYTNVEKDLRKELLQMDKIGVPYSLTLEEVTLKNGLLKLRNRDTTLSEIIHVSDVPNYLQKIFNS